MDTTLRYLTCAPHLQVRLILRAFLLEVTWLEREASNSLLSDAQFKNAPSFIPATLKVCMARHLDARTDVPECLQADGWTWIHCRSAERF